MTLLFVTVGLALALAGDYTFKSDRHVWLGFILYATSGIPVWFSYRHGSWMEVAMYWSVLAILISALMGVTIFGEVLTGRQQIAFVLAVIAVAMWNLK
ncbi:MAG TPA: hypothetical protein VKT75_10610 [Acidobacteriaceae bacterium]|nr:hypothetical protein [Acidobacteriaceae bacterium]